MIATNDQHLEKFGSHFEFGERFFKFRFVHFGSITFLSRFGSRHFDFAHRNYEMSVRELLISKNSVV